MNKCSDCPVAVRIFGAGVVNVKSSELIKCCRVKKQIDAANRILKGDK